MAETLDQLKPAILALTNAERDELADWFFNYLPKPEGVLEEDSPELDAALDRRLAAYESGASPGISGKEFLRRLPESRR